MDFKLNLNSDSILEKKFQKDVRGYNALEVDNFLDYVIADYQEFEKALSEKNTEIQNLQGLLAKEKEKNHDLSIDNAKMNMRLSSIGPSNGVSSDNLDLIKKINCYEAYLFSIGVDPSQIK